jgi:hypothetical protein
MRNLMQQWTAVFFLLTAAAPAWGQIPSTSLTAGIAPVQPLLDFRDSDVKFDLQSLMYTLRDHRHEGWVLAAYPDPVTHHPLIGAGFSLDLPDREHLQQNPFNPRSFLEPSSAELWQTAGLDAGELQKILLQFDEEAIVRASRKYRRKRIQLTPQISDEEGMRLLRIAVIQAIYNAKAYCRDFDDLTSSQQMAMTQLVYQMGMNLEEFNQFLGVINDDSNSMLLVLSPAAANIAHWEAAQDELIQSQWARRYRARAISVIAMLDPHYLDDPVAAEMHVSAQLPPMIVQTHNHSSSSLRNVSYKKHSGRSGSKQATRNKKKI